MAKANANRSHSPVLNLTLDVLGKLVGALGDVEEVVFVAVNDFIVVVGTPFNCVVTCNKPSTVDTNEHFIDIFHNFFANVGICIAIAGKPIPAASVSNLSTPISFIGLIRTPSKTIPIITL
jgi:hypothetical protein